MHEAIPNFTIAMHKDMSLDAVKGSSITQRWTFKVDCICSHLQESSAGCCPDNYSLEVGMS